MHQDNDYEPIMVAIENADYESAIRICDALLGSSVERDLGVPFAQKMDAQIALGRLAEALSTALEYHAHCKEFSRNHFPISAKVELAYAYWLNGKPGEAVKALVGEIEGLRSGELSMVDASGGAGLGVMLLYYSMECGDTEAEECALSWLKEVLSKRRSANWPGPMARCLLGELELNEALLQIASVIGGNLDEVIATANGHSYRYEAHQVLFYLAVKARLADDEGEAQRMLSLLAATPHRSSSDLQNLAAMEKVTLRSN